MPGPIPLDPPDDRLLPCSCLLCRTEVHAPPGGRLPYLDVVGLGSGYKLIAHDCDDPDLDAMWDDLGLIPGLIRPADVGPTPRGPD